ncbi:uncharacterized protein H6S33_006326 [Morchella sextelata]|uniref:uncharacterized protein n=1 Tax=Morchella sextelata TaxID=1174677 RepID=UPI001D03C7B5|nr:uncharacterized protein H6S33_006326 [Morchella sextelata]KAH0604658.1 hypothetical protein H6S33_006326 [Morchella sextelata]
MATTPTPNYIDPPSRAAMVVGTNTGMICAAGFFVGLRVFTRYRLTNLGSDDILICVAWLLSFCMTMAIIFSTKYGNGRHTWDVPPEWRSMSGKLGYTFTALYNPTLMMTKTSILAFYINKLGSEETFRKVCWVTMGYVICSSTSIFFSNIFQCSPIRGGWDYTAPGRKCINTTPLYYFSGANNLITDLVLLFLPMPVIWKLRLPLRQKLGLVMVFSMGIFVTCVSIVRIHMVSVAMVSKDLSWTGSVSSTWSAVELNVAIICACTPAFKQFLTWVAPGILGTSIKKSAYYGSGGLRYHTNDGTGGVAVGTRKSHLGGLGRTAGAGATCTITATHNNDSEEYIMHDLAGEPHQGMGISVNKTVEVVVQSESVKDDSTSSQGRNVARVGSW